MQLYNFLLIKRLILLITFSVILFSCSSYQYSGNISDGIYSENKNIDSQKEYTQEPIYEKEVKNSYYQTVFSEKSMQYEEAKSLNDSVFTDVENYQGLVENDSINENYAPWGENIDHLTINLYRGHAYNSIHWSRMWNYPIWLNNYGYGYGSAWNSWGYGYNNYWLRPYHYGLYNDFFSPFWSWGHYGYYHPFYSPYYYSNNFYNYPYFQNQWNNTSIAYISGGRRSRNASSLRSGYTTSINNRVNNLNSSSLRDRISRIDRINSAARVKPAYYSKPVSNYGAGSKPSNNTNNKPNTKPSSNYNYKPSGYNSKPSSNSSPSFNSSFKPSSSSGSSRPSSSSSSSSGSRGGKSGGRSGGY